MGVVGVIAVSAQKDRLAHMVKDENLSSIEVMSDEVGVSQDEVRTMLQELLEQGVLKGRITEDGMRFFQDGAKVSEHPSIPTKEEEPEFLKFNTKPRPLSGRSRPRSCCDFLSDLGHIPWKHGCGKRHRWDDTHRLSLDNGRLLLHRPSQDSFVM